MLQPAMQSIPSGLLMGPDCERKRAETVDVAGVGGGGGMFLGVSTGLAFGKPPGKPKGCLTVMILVLTTRFIEM